MKTSRAILGIGAGIAAGVILGVLMAPNSGDDTRKKIVSKTQDAVTDLKARFDALVNSFVTQKDEMIQTSKNKVTDLANKVADSANKVADSARKVNV